MIDASKRERKKNQRMILKDKQHLSEDGEKNINIR